MRVSAAWLLVLAAFPAAGADPAALAEGESAEARDQFLQKLKGVGRRRYQVGDFAGAVEAFSAAIEAAPEEANNYAYLANALFRSGELEEAEATFRLAIEMRPNEPRFHANLGGLMAHQERYHDALASYDVARKLQPEDGTLQKNFETTEMLINVQNMLAELDDMSGAHYDLSGFLSGANYTDKTEVTLRFALEQHPKYINRALQVLREAVQRQPEFAIMSHVLANTLTFAAGLSSPDHKEKMKHSPFDLPRDSPFVQEAQTVLARSLDQRHSLANATCPALADAQVCRSIAADVGGGVSDAPVRVVAVATVMRTELVRLQQSAGAMGMVVDVLGLGQPWEGLGSKVTFLSEYLADVPADDLVLFLDAYDVMLLTPAKDLRERFRAFGKPLVFGAELNCAPDAGMVVAYSKPARDQAFWFLNSGTYVGRAGDIRAMLWEIQLDIRTHHQFTGASKHRLDDQRWFHRHYLRNPASVALDVKGALFHTLHDVKPPQLHVRGDGAVFSDVTQTFPSVLHGNGNGLTTFHDISKRLVDSGWPPDASFDSSTSVL